MDPRIARHLIRTAFRTSRELQDALAFIKRTCLEGEYKMYAIDLASAIHSVHSALIDRPLASVPELRAEIDADIATYDRYLQVGRRIP